MNSIGPVLLVLAGVILGWIALSAEERTYAGPVSVEPPENVPYALAGDVPVGSVVRMLEVDGICCMGCPGKLWVALDQLDAVQEAAIDPIQHRAMAVVPSELDVAVLEEALTFGKYSAQVLEESAAH